MRAIVHRDSLAYRGLDLLSKNRSSYRKLAGGSTATLYFIIVEFIRLIELFTAYITILDKAIVAQHIYLVEKFSYHILANYTR